MSASLVGSEMCIRDRNVCVRIGLQRIQINGARAARAFTPPPPSTTMPVSYTHLTLPTICSV
eukprot:2848461-Alexandrium_andersonii.AAC.1